MLECKFHVKRRKKIIAITALVAVLALNAQGSKDMGLCNKQQRADLGALETLNCFLGLDFQGERLILGADRISPYELTDWAQVPGWDSLEVIQDYIVNKITCPKVEVGVECFKVEFKIRGHIESSFKSTTLGRTKINNKSFVLKKMNGVWRIVSPDPYPPQVGIAATTRHLEKLVADLGNTKDKDPYNNKEKIWKLLHKLGKM